VKAASIQAVCNFYSCTQAIIIVEGHAAHKSLLFLPLLAESAQNHQDALELGAHTSALSVL